MELDPAPARITQFSLLQRALPSPETLSTLIARLSALVGETRVGSPVLLDTYQPGAFELTRYAPEKGPASARASTCASYADASPKPRRGEGGTEGAEDVDAGASVLRRQRIPPAIRVRVEHGRPVHVAAAKRGMPHGAVIQAAGPWRTSGGWWNGDTCRAEGNADPCRAKGNGDACREGGNADARWAAWNRDEWDVALTSGVVCRIFQDRTTERWFLEGTYD